MEPLTILMSSFAAIKGGVAAGREMTGLAKEIGKLFDSIDDIRNDHNKAKSNPLLSVNEEAMETFIAKKKAEDVEKELRHIVIATRGVDGWQQLQKLRIEIRRQREEAKKQKRLERIRFQETFWNVVLFFLGVLFLCGITLGSLWFARHRGHI